MRITWKWVLVLSGVMITGPLWFQLVTKPLSLFDDNRFLKVSIGVFLLSGFVALISLIIDSIVQKNHLKTRIFFFGQLAVPFLFAAIFLYINISRKIYKDTQANIDANREFIRFSFDEGEYRSRGLSALNQLETKFANRNDIHLVYVDTDRIDTVMNDRSDYVTVFYFEYTDKNRPGENMYSKHLIGYHNQVMAFYDVPDKALPETKRKKEEERKQAVERLKEVEEAIKDLKLDTILQTP